MPIATVTSKGQITIPKEVREALEVAAGDRIEFVAVEKGVYKLVVVTRDVRHLKGLVPKPAKPVSIDAMNRAVAKRFVGSDKRAGDVAHRSKRLLREHFRGK